MRNVTLLLLTVATLIFHPLGMQAAQQRAGDAGAGSAYLLIQVSTYRIGTTQYATATASVRRSGSPDKKEGVEVLTCQIIEPTKGKKSTGRRTEKTMAKAEWKIDSDADVSMKDFKVKATASSSSIDDLQTTQIFKYSELK